MKKKLVNRTSELYFQDKLSLPRTFFQNPAVQDVSPGRILLIPFIDS